MLKALRAHAFFRRLSGQHLERAIRPAAAGGKEAGCRRVLWEAEAGEEGAGRPSVCSQLRVWDLPEGIRVHRQVCVCTHAFRQFVLLCCFFVCFFVGEAMLHVTNPKQTLLSWLLGSTCSASWNTPSPSCTSRENTPPPASASCLLIGPTDWRWPRSPSGPRSQFWPSVGPFSALDRSKNCFLFFSPFSQFAPKVTSVEDV